MDERERLKGVIDTLLSKQQAPQDLTELRRLEEEERERNRRRELANILGSGAARTTGATPISDLAIDNTAKKQLMQALAGRNTGNITDRDRLNAALQKYAQAEINARQEEGLKRRDKGLDISAEKVDIQKQDKVTDLSKQLNKTGASKLIQKGTHLMDRLEKLSDPKDIPGFGVAQSAGRKVPGIGGLITDAFFTSEEGRDIRGSFQSMLNESIKTFAGSAATVAEVERVMEEVNQGKLNSEEDFLNALERVYSTYENDTQNTLAGFSPEARAKYMEGGGKDLLNQVAGLRSRLTAFRKSRAGDKVREVTQTQTDRSSGELSAEEQKELEELERLEAEGNL